MAATNDLGSLSYSLNIDISQLPNTIRDVEKQLSGISTVADISTRVDANQLIGAIKQALVSEDFKLKVSLDDSFKSAIGKSLSILNNASGSISESSIDNQIGYIDSLISKLKELEAQYKALPKGADASGLIAEFKSVQVELDKVGKNLSLAFNKSWDEVSKMSEATISDIKNKIKSLDQYKLVIPVANKDEIESVNKLISKLKGDISSLTKPTKTKDMSEVLGMDTGSLNQIADKLKEIRRLRGDINVNTPNGMSQLNSLNRAEADLLRVQQQRLDINKQIVANYQSQSQIVDNLIGKAIAYFGIQKLEQFASKLIEIRGEFEKQQIALQVILQSKDQADKLFSQVADLGLKSPFSIMQLNSYVKGLSAYRVETGQLFDTTKRLADISSGLGVDMGRLILAFGQVKAASVLRGQELRQFTEAGLPLIEELADKFTELEGRVISTDEVFGKISDRLVPFEMVRDVLFEMTDAGGEFFNMQEKQAEALGSKWKNLQDAIDLMYNSIGKEEDGFLKGMAEGLTSLTENWREILAITESVVATLGTYKILMIATGVGAGKLASNLTMVYGSHAGAVSKIIASQNMWSRSIATTGVAARALGMQLKSLLATNGPMIVAAAIVGIGTAIYNTYQEATRFKNELASIAIEGVKNTNSLTEAHKELKDKINETTEGTIARKEAIDSLNNQFGSYYSTLLTEANALQMLKGEYDDVNAKIKENARLKGAEDIKSKINDKYKDDTNRIYNRILNDAANPGMFAFGQDAIPKKLMGTIMERIGEKAKKDGRDPMFIPFREVAKEVAKEVELTSRQTSTLLNQIKSFDKDGISTYFRNTLGTLSETNRALEDFYIQMDDKMPDATGKKIQDFDKEMAAIETRLEKAKKEANNLPSDKKNSRDRAVNEAEKKALQEKIALADKFNWVSKKGDFEKQLKGITIGVNQIQKASEELFGLDSSQFSAFKQLTSAESIQGEYKRLTDSLKYPKLYNPEKDKNGLTDLEKDKARLENLKKLAGKLELDLGSKGSIHPLKEIEDARIAKYKAEIALVKEANSAYKEYLDVFDESNAKAKVEDNFASQFKSLGVDIKYASDELSYYQSITEKLSNGTSKKDIALWNSVNKEIGGTQSKQEIEALKKQWQDLNDLFDLKKEAYALRDMYMQKGVSKEVSESFVKQIYGDIPIAFDNFQDDVAAKLSDAGIYWGSNYGKSFKKTFGQESKNSFLDMLDKFQTTQQKIEGINYKYSQIFKELEVQKGKVSEDMYAGMVANAKAAKDEELAAVTEGLLEMTDAYQRLFGNISDMSEKEMSYLIGKFKKSIEQAQAAGKGLDGLFHFEIDGQQFSKTEKQMASLVKSLTKAEKDLRNKNPFKSLADDFKQLQSGLQNKNIKKDEINSLEKYIEATKNIEGYDSSPILQSSVGSAEKKLSSLNDQLKDIDAQNASTWMAMSSKISAVTQSVMDLGESVGSLLEAFGADEDTTGTLNDIMGIVGGLGDTASGVARIAGGDIIGGLAQSIKGIAGVVSSITSLSDRNNEKQIRRLQEAIEASKIAYEELGRAAAKALGNAEYDTKKLQIAELKRQQQLIQGQIKSENDKKKTDKDKIKNWETEYRQLGNEIEDIITDITDSLTGNLKDMANEMASALIEAFEAGDNAQEAMFKSIKNNLKQTISQQFQKTVVESALAPLFKRMNEMLGIDDQGNATYKSFTPEQVVELIGKAESISKEVMDIFNSGGWKEIFDALTSGGDLSALSKGIQGLTEDTAQIIEAYLNTIRDVTISIMVNSENQLSVLQASQLIQSQILTEVASMGSATISISNAIRSVIAQSNGDSGAGIRVYIK